VDITPDFNSTARALPTFILIAQSSNPARSTLRVHLSSISKKIMKKKTQQVTKFIEGLHQHVIGDPQFRRNTRKKSEIAVQAELRPLIVDYLKKYYQESGYKDFILKANQAFYWEGQEGKFGRERKPIFGARNYPDFIITEPYLVAIEYKQSTNGSTVKTGLGQSMMHTLGRDFDFVYYLFHDESEGKKIEKSAKSEPEKQVLEKMWSDFNVFVKFV
jgi:hypothetical protein